MPDAPLVQWALVKRHNGHVVAGPYPSPIIPRSELALSRHPNRYEIRRRELTPGSWEPDPEENP